MSNPEDIKDDFPYQIDEFYLDLQFDGSSIAILDEEEIKKKPFPGLRPFKTSEFQLFKGRGDQVEELIKRLKKNNVLAVIGSSGTGKSSLVRAGLIPQLLGGYLHEAGNKWNIAICRPGKNPVENLAIALSSVKSRSKDRDDIIRDFKLIKPFLTNSVYGILDVNEILNTDKSEGVKHNLLVIVDQFEELFRFHRKDLDKENIESHFVNLLLKATLNPESSVYVIITMRSEFLGDCVKFRGLPEAINEGQYLVPQLTRTQLKEAIQGPIRLADKKIDPGLVELLINEIDENNLKENLDQLPILQHALMRSYNQAMLEGDETEICYNHYESIGTMKKALANHAEAKYDALGVKNSSSNTPSKQQKITKIIFQALTDTSTDQKGGRRPIELGNIYAIAEYLKATHKEVDEVINHFREAETSFIMPPINTTLHPGLILDISHESLMRNWEKLNEWMDEEVKNGRLYRMLNERRILNERGGGNDQFISGALLTEMLSWENLGHNSAWASRYHTKSDLINNETEEEIYIKNLNFLRASNEEAIKIKNFEKEALLEKIRLARRERIRITAILSVALIISSLFGFFAWKTQKKANDSSNRALKNEIKANASKKEAKLYSEIADQQNKERDLITFERKIELRKWWGDTTYLTWNLKRDIKDSLISWYIKHPNHQDSILARKLDYSLRILHEAETLKHDTDTYVKLICYVYQYDKNLVTRSAFDSVRVTMPTKLTNNFPNNTTLIHIMESIGKDYFSENNYMGAILAFNEILASGSAYAPAWNMIGKASYSSKNYQEAILSYHKAIKLNPDDLDYMTNLGETYIAMHDYNKADSILNKVIGIGPGNVRALGLLGQSLYHNKKYLEAIEKFKNIINKGNTSSLIYGWLVKTYKKLNKPDTGRYIKLLKKASSGNYDNWFALADYYDDQNDYNNAIYWYKKYIDKGNDSKTFWVPYNNIALDFCRLSKANFSEAIRYADRAIDLTENQLALTKEQLILAQSSFVQSGTQFVPNPANPYAHKGYAYLIESQTQTKDSLKYQNQALAIINIEQALNIDPNYPKTHFYHACYYALNGRKKEAVDALRVAIENGFDGISWIKSEVMLKSIRNEAGYRKLIDQLEKDPNAN